MVYHNATESELKFRLGGRVVRVAIGDEIAVPEWLVYSVESKGIRLTPGPRPADADVVEPLPEPEPIAAAPVVVAASSSGELDPADVEDDDAEDLTEEELEALTKPD